VSCLPLDYARVGSPPADGRGGLVKVEGLRKKIHQKPSRSHRPDLSEIAVSPCPELPRMPRFDVLKMGVLGGRPGDRRETANDALFASLGSRPKPSGRPMRTGRPRIWVASSKVPVSCEAPPLSTTRAFGSAAKGEIREPIPDHFKNLLGAVPNDVRQRGRGTRSAAHPDRPSAGGRHGHQLTRVGPAGQHRAI